MGNFSKYRFRLVVYVLLLFITETSVFSQCITNIDFSTWSQAGYTANGNWVVQNGGSQVHQTVNGNPTFYISPFKLICVKITGEFKTANNDDDFMGFVFSFLNPLGQSDNYDGWLFDWKQVAQASGGYTGQRGMALNRMLGTIPSSAYTQTFWGHQNTPEFNVVQNDFGGIGWVKNQNHHFELRLSYTRATIFIDGDSVFDYEACYLPGYFGFYNYSQPDCYYSNFNFEPYIEFDVLTPQICARDTAAFRFVNICQDSSLYDFSSFQSMTWDFGDGNTFVNNNINIHNVNATHRYAQPGTYNVVLSVQDYQGCIGKDTQQVVVKPLPVPDFSAPGACFGASAPFVNQSTISADSISGYLWSFGEPSSGVLDTSSLQSPSHLYATCDTFSVQLVAISNIGCRDTTSKNVIIHALPVAQFTAPVNTCPGKQVLFTEASTIPNTDTIQSWIWNFADGSPLLNQQEVTGGHVYDTAGTYNVSLVATSTFGCKDTITKTLFVRPKPVANFGSSKVCNGTATVFSDSSTTSAGSINAWGWNFADGGTNITQNPSHLYANAGIHNVTLIAQNTFA
ncbi:MAG: PKD domain-containing protein, partial [Bacteroidia bacterium]